MLDESRAGKTLRYIPIMLRAHIDAGVECKLWIDRSIELRKAGKLKEARAAQRQARDWVLKLMNLE